MEYIIAVIVGITIASQPVVKGFIGNIITKITMSRLDKKVYTIFNKVNITRKDGTVDQIDQVILSNYGIFVIRKMNMSGSIFGDELMKEWSQIRMGPKSKFPSPVIENKGKMKSLAANLGEHKSKFISVISFTNKGILRKVVTDTPVVLSIWVARTVKSYDKVLLNDAEVEAVKKRIGDMCD